MARDYEAEPVSTVELGKMVARYRAGWSCTQIGRDQGYPTARVAELLREAGVEVRRGRRPKDSLPSTQENVAEKEKKQKPPNETEGWIKTIADVQEADKVAGWRYAKSASAIVEEAKKKVSEYMTATSDEDEPDAVEIVKAYRNGATMQHLADVHEMSVREVRDILEDAGEWIRRGRGKARLPQEQPRAQAMQDAAAGSSSIDADCAVDDLFRRVAELEKAANAMQHDLTDHTFFRCRLEEQLQPILRLLAVMRGDA